MSILGRTSSASGGSVELTDMQGQSSELAMSQKGATNLVSNPDSTGVVNVQIGSNLGFNNAADKRIVIGTNTIGTVGVNGVLIGGRPTSGFSNSVQIGLNLDANKTAGVDAVTIGTDATTGTRGCAVGKYTSASANDSTAYGYYSKATANYSTALGALANAAGAHSVALGGQSTAAIPSVVSVGDGSSNADYGKRRIINVSDPVNPQDAATKNYVDTNFASTEYVDNAVSTTSSTTPSFASELKFYNSSDTFTVTTGNPDYLYLTTVKTQDSTIYYVEIVCDNTSTIGSITSTKDVAHSAAMTPPDIPSSYQGMAYQWQGLIRADGTYPQNVWVRTSNSYGNQITFHELIPQTAANNYASMTNLYFDPGKIFCLRANFSFIKRN